MIDHIRKGRRVSLKETFRKTRVLQPKRSVKILEHALERLNETQRSLVMLKDYEGYTYEDRTDNRTERNE